MRPRSPSVLPTHAEPEPAYQVFGDVMSDLPKSVVAVVRVDQLDRLGGSFEVGLDRVGGRGWVLRHEQGGESGHDRGGLAGTAGLLEAGADLAGGDVLVDEPARAPRRLMTDTPGATTSTPRVDAAVLGEVGDRSRRLVLIVPRGVAGADGDDQW